MDKVNGHEIQLMYEAAKNVLDNAFTPMTKFPTASVVLTERGNMYEGVNVETTISGMGTCSERAAIYHAMSHGEYSYRAILITTKNEEPVKPCGMCLQQIAEAAQIANHDVEIIMVGSTGKTNKSSIYKMLPDAWGPRSLGADLSSYESR